MWGDQEADGKNKNTWSSKGNVLQVQLFIVIIGSRGSFYGSFQSHVVLRFRQKVTGRRRPV
jgi:hypothetical protein